MEQSEETNARRAGFWEGSLGYPQAVAVALAAFAVGIVYQWRIPRMPQVPFSIAAGICAAFVVIVGFASLRWRRTRVMEWITGIPFAVVSIVGVMLLAAVGAAVPEATLRARFGMQSAYSSWPFAMMLFVMLTNLVGVSARRMWPLSFRNVRFTLNHLGLAVTLIGGVMSAAGLERSNLVLELGHPTAMAEAVDGKPVPLPFQATLRQFRLASFPPTLALAESDPKAPDGARITAGEQFAKPGLTERIGPYSVKVLEYLPRAAKVGGVWRAVNFPTAAPAVRVEVSDAAGHPAAAGWVSSGSVDTESAFLPLGEDRALFMPPPRPREFRSTVAIFRDGRTEVREIRVNQPISVGPYRLYQLSYDEKMGAASEFSVIEVVRDRGLPVVYAGLFMLLAGAALFLWEGAREGGSE
ncbi:MAG TPA: cytochrome c biogenesis protein ResB [Armatimonadota bacterium]|jgi:hypothetical protein